MLQISNKTSTILTAGQVIPFNIVTPDTNNDASFDSVNNEILINRGGYYEICANIVFAPTTAGDSSIQMFVNEEEDPLATVTYTTSLATQKITFPISSRIIKTVTTQGNTDVSIKFITSVAGTLISANVTEKRLS